MITCDVCPHLCSLSEGQLGFCRARRNDGQRIVDDNYGKITSIALDPIEKKPLKRFYPGSYVLSVGSYGCNLRCSFCQNHEISMRDGRGEALFLSPEELVEKAKSLQSEGNIGLAFTYNEPLVGFEYVLNCSVLAAKEGLQNVCVTNGYINEEPLKKLLPSIHAMNIDLKGFTESFYQDLKGDLETVKNTIALASKTCHVEVTTLVIPGKNDTHQEMEALASWLASVSPYIPLHLTRFFPRYKMNDREGTSKEKIYELFRIAKEKLEYVFAGNMY